MTINRIKTDLAVLKAEIKVKHALPWDCKSLMMQFRDESLHREIYKKLCKAKVEYYEEPEPIELHYDNFGNLSWQAREFLKMSDIEKVAAIEKEFPPKKCTEEEAEETSRKIMSKINRMRERMRNDYSIS
jgi:hypothetical protein